ncbi:MAG: type II and III secretion system protein [Pseudomonadota bacterium]
MNRTDTPALYKADGDAAARQAAAQRRQSTNRDDAEAATSSETSEAVEDTTVVTPGASLPGLNTMAVTAGQDFVPELTGDNISGAYNNIPLPAFIDVVFGEQLGLPYSLDSAIRSQSDLVTLRLAEPVSPRDLFVIARRTLTDYGVRLRVEQGVYVFNIDRNVDSTDVPILISGRALPEVPDSQRPVFVFVPLKAVQPNKVRNWLTIGMSGQGVAIQEDPARNSILLRGKSAVVEQALAMIKVLDQPHMRGRFSVSIEPAYAQVKDLAKDLVSVLGSEGYDVSTRPPDGAILIIPLQSSNQLIAFASDQETISHVEDWARQIDRRQQLAVEDGIFSYEVNSTQASYIVELLNELMNGDAIAQEALRSNLAGGQNDSAAMGATAGLQRRPNQFVVDSNRNAIIFRGSGKKWAELLPVIKEMDELAPSVLVEVLLAEISLNDTENSSFQFLANTTLDRYNLTYGTLDLISPATSAFSATLDKAGDVRAVLNLLYENRRAEIRSRPRLMVKSGQTATIDVGDEIPILTTSSQSTQNPDAPLLQEVVYRSTGVKLSIKPVVHNSGFVDIEVTQELSEAEVNETSGIDSPTIRNRSLQTIVTLRDGGSILLGGLISSTTSDNETGVPFFGTLPGVGRLFRGDGEQQTRSELLVMIIPYVMDRPQDAEDITEQLTNSFVANSDARLVAP